MLSFLKLVLAVVVTIAVLILVAYFVIRRKIKSWWSKCVESAQQGLASAVPPFRIRLQRVEGGNANVMSAFLNPAGSKKNGTKVDKLTEELASLHFTQIGDFAAYEAHTTLRAFQHHEHQAFAILYDHMMAGVWCDIYRRYSDNTSWTYTNRVDDLADRPPWRTAKFMPEVSLEELLSTFLTESPSEGVLKSGADQFVKAFEAHWAREMNWRITQGGATKAEILRIAKRDGIELTEEDVAQAQQPWKEAISEFLSDRMIQNWRSQSEETKERFGALEHRLVGVHPRMTPKQLLAAVDDEYFAGAEEPDAELEEVDAETKKWRQDLGVVEKACKQRSPITVFRALLKRYKSTEQFELVGSVERPIKGEIWLRPKQEDFDEHEGIDVAEYDDIDD